MMEREARPDTGRGENPIFRFLIRNSRVIHKIKLQGDTPLHFIGLYATKKVPNTQSRSNRLSVCPTGRKSIAASFCRFSSASSGAKYYELAGNNVPDAVRPGKLLCGLGALLPCLFLCPKTLNTQR